MSNQIDLEQLEAKNRRNNIIVIILAVVLAVVLALFLMQQRDHKVIMNDLRIEKDSIRTDLYRISESYDSLKTENDTMSTQLLYAQEKVKDLLQEVEQTKRVSFRKISDYQKQVTTLRGIMRNFVVQIDSLNRKNEQLMAENMAVKKQYKQVEQKNKQLNETIEQQQQSLKRASALSARDLVASPLNSRSKVTKFAKRANKIRIYFVLGNNLTTKRGAKKIYARIMRPDQLLLAKSDDDVFKFEDLKIQYSAMREVVYEGKDLPVAIFWDNSNEPQLMPGTYTVNLFSDGNEIGETTFLIK